MSVAKHEMEARDSEDAVLADLEAYIAKELVTKVGIPGPQAELYACWLSLGLFTRFRITRRGVR